MTLDASFDELAATIPATVGVAIVSPGRSEVISYGPWSSGVAWSTVKVPLAVAAVRSRPQEARPLLRKLICESDNPSSETLWSFLGEPSDAAIRVQAVIAEAGDESTVVESRRLRSGFTAFGQTRWALSDQARFAANLAHVPGAAEIIDLMHDLKADQRWGFAAKGAAAKGGWGPGAHDGYLVRQFAMIPVDAGHVGVAMAAQAATFDAGVAALNLLADWIWP